MSKLIKPVPSLEEQRKEQEKLHDTLLLLDHLFRREEATAKMILGNLYDIATINLINNKVPVKMTHPFLKLITKTSKPVASIIAVRAFQTYCPKLINDYLYSLVEFKVKEEKQSLKAIEMEALSLSEVESKLQQVKTLKKQVRLLTGSLIATMMIFFGSSFFVFYKLGLSPQEIFQPAQTAQK